MRPNPHLLFWLLCLFLLFACFASASVTYRYVRWSADPPAQESRSQIWVFGLHHVLRHLNADTVTGGPAPSPAPSAGAYPTGAGPYLVLINLLVLGLSYYVFSRLPRGDEPVHVLPILHVVVLDHARDPRSCRGDRLIFCFRLSRASAVSGAGFTLLQQAPEPRGGPCERRERFQADSKYDDLGEFTKATL